MAIMRWYVCRSVCNPIYLNRDDMRASFLVRFGMPASICNVFAVVGSFLFAKRGFGLIDQTEKSTNHFIMATLCISRVEKILCVFVVVVVIHSFSLCTRFTIQFDSSIIYML